MLLDARGAQWSSPFGLIGMLTAGQALAEAEARAAAVHGAPQRRRASATGLARLLPSRRGAVRAARQGAEGRGDRAVGRAARRDAGARLGGRARGGRQDLGGGVPNPAWRAGSREKATLRFSMALSEACQNIVEHAGTSGWVAVQAYTFRRRLGRRVVVIAVSDAGVGFRRSLESTHAKRFGERWGDGAALEAALIQGVSRFRDPAGPGPRVHQAISRSSGRARSPSAAARRVCRSCRRGTRTSR